MKKLTLGVAFLIFAMLCAAPVVFAESSPSPAAPGAPSGFVALAPILGLTDANSTSVINSGSFANFFNNLYKYLIGLAAILAIIEIIWGGLEISTQDSVSKQSNGKERITQAIIGLILVLSPVLVFSIINPSILNLSLGIDKLDTVTPASNNSDGSTGNQPSVIDPASGCNVVGSNGLFKTASCPNQAAANSFNCNDPALSQVVPACKSIDPITHACLDQTITIYCAGGKSPTLTYYIYLGKLSLSTPSVAKQTIISSQKATFDSFIASCKAAGGVPSDPPSTVFTGMSTIPCTADMNIPPINVSIYGTNGEARCLTSKLTCNAPS
ncbi:hypothetical protein KGM48_00555 [Patescibacteria group bacterium]|nr:hypothetical protein [Patescibacteria group bacterium]